MAYTVYMHRFPNGKVYIGITAKTVNKRWLNGRGYQTQNVYKAIKKYGWDNIEHVVLESNLSKQDAEKKEIELISFYDATNPERGYNIENGGNLAGKHSEQTCKKISEHKKGWNPSPETRKRMSDAKKGKPVSPELMESIRNRPHRPLNEKQRQALLAANVGKTVSEETRQKLREANLGKKHTQEHKDKISRSGRIAQRKCKAVRVVQLTMDGEYIKTWDCMTDITETLGINQASICDCCKGRRNKAGGFRWKYADKREAEKNIGVSV